VYGAYKNTHHVKRLWKCFSKNCISVIPVKSRKHLHFPESWNIYLLSQKGTAEWQGVHDIVWGLITVHFELAWPIVLKKIYTCQSTSPGQSNESKFCATSPTPGVSFQAQPLTPTHQIKSQAVVKRKEIYYMSWACHSKQQSKYKNPFSGYRYDFYV
jgi:hypothetical protein